MSGRGLPALPARLLLLGMAAGALGAIIAVEWRGSATRLPPPSQDTAQPAQAVPVQSADTAKERTSHYVADILARPLVSPNRRPGTAIASESVGLPRLTGVLISSGGKVAIFAGATGAKSLAVSEGERVGAYLIAAIGSDGVTIVGPQGDRLLRPAFDPNPPPILRLPNPPIGK